MIGLFSNLARLKELADFLYPFFRVFISIADLSKRSNQVPEQSWMKKKKDPIRTGLKNEPANFQQPDAANRP
ncbi:hypothetical protein quinque_009485 [Culex quinquefasciatus]